VQAGNTGFGAANVNLDCTSCLGIILTSLESDIKAEVKDNYVKITYTTDSRYSQNEFFLEKSLNGIDFITYHERKPFTDFSDTKYTLSWHDTQISSEQYYRVRQVSPNLSEYISKIIQVTFQEESLSISPNPFDDFIQINFSSKQEKCMRLDLLEPSGKILITDYQPNHQAGSAILFTTPMLQEGLYFLHIQTNRGVYHQKIVKK
jgi:hypothetical protein